MRAVAAGLQAALLLARGRTDALDALGPATDAIASAKRSFWAMAFCLPAFVCLHLVAALGTTAGAPATSPTLSAHSFAVDLLGFVIGWMVFALASYRITAMLGRAAMWPRFITLWNWCNLIQYVMLVVATLPDLLGLPEIVGQTAWLVAFGWAMWLEWFMTRLALVIPAPLAAALVLLDVAVGLIVAGFTG